jgi:hypothetical protein
MTTDLPHGDRIAFSTAVLKILDDWGLPAQAQLDLLGLGQGTEHRATRRWGVPLPDNPEVYQRVALLLSLDRALRQLFPHSEVSANLWVTTPRPKFGNATPLDTMLRGGLEGIRSVLAALDNLDLR